MAQPGQVRNGSHSIADPQPSSPEGGQQLRKIVEWLHHRMAAAQNLPYEDGDVCPECAETVRDELMPLIQMSWELFDRKNAGGRQSGQHGR
jgi:hypothetical protein